MHVYMHVSRQSSTKEGEQASSLRLLSPSCLRLFVSSRLVFIQNVSCIEHRHSLSPLDNSLFNLWRGRVLADGPLTLRNIKQKMSAAWETITRDDILTPI